MDPGMGYNYMRALYGFVLCTGVAVGCSFAWPHRHPERIKGLWVGSIAEAKIRFKGGKPNDDDLGKQIRLKLISGPPLEIDGADIVPVLLTSADAEQMKAQGGDLIYVCDRRWWLGGLRSTHARMRIDNSHPGAVVVPSNFIEAARLKVGEEVKVEKII